MAILNPSLYEREETMPPEANDEAGKLYDRVVKLGDHVNLADDWDAVYHLSSLRENVLCWYPFKKDCTILEIGINYGELTGMLAQKAKMVTVCETSMQRAKLIFERTLKAGNVEIIPGDFRKLPTETKFDYIILNGALESAGDIIGYDGNPALRLLEQAKEYLKDDGIILAAMENRLGLRYFSGAAEENTGKTFAGIEGSWEENKPRTYDRKQISDLIRDAGLTINQWFYPFPDYRFTKEIFTDTSLEQIIPNFAGEITDKDRPVLFSEQKVQRSLAENHIAPCFCNSFLMEITKGAKASSCSGYDYVKLSNDRDERFAIYTVIDYGENKAYKIPCTEDGKTHLQKICSFSITEGKIRTLPYQWDGEKAVCDLLHSETLLDKLESSAETGDREGYWQELEELKTTFYTWKGSGKQNPREFEKIFGKQKAGQELKWVTGLPMDCMAGNIYLENGQWTLIDYEWLFDCAVPAEFILWRTLYQLKMYPSMHGMFENRDTNEFIGINEETEKVFLDWENGFENGYVQVKVTLRSGKTRIQIEEIQARQEELTTQVQQLNQEILVLNEEKRQLTEEVQTRQAELSAQNQQLAKANSDLQNEKSALILQKKKAENDWRIAEDLLRHIQESGMYRFSLKYYKVRDKIFPEGSRRQRFAKSIVWKLKGEKGPLKTGKAYQNQIEHLLNYGKMGKIGIVTTRHTMYIAKLFAKELERLSIETVIHTGEPKQYEEIPYIIICPQFVRQFPALYIAVQMEQTVSSRWFNDEYFAKLQNSCAIFDYSLENIDFYQQGKYKDIYSRVYYLPVDYYPGYATTEKEPTKEYDVVFYGDAKSCERRRNILKELGKEFKVKICSEVFGEEVYNEIRKAKVLVNIHYYEGALLETTRIYETLSLNTCVIVSEDSKDKAERARMEGLVDFAEIGNVEELKEKIRYWVHHDKERNAKIQENRTILESRPNAFTFFFQRFMLACDQIDFNKFYKMCGDYVQVQNDRVCLSLPESTMRRKSFDAANKYGFVCFPGLRHYKGWVGCGLSYKMIFTKAQESGLKEIMICEDDVIFPDDFAGQIDKIQRFLHSQPRWSVFSGLIADVGKVSAVTEREEMGDASILKIDHMVSTVFNIYNKEVFRHFMKWNEKNRDVHKNAIDRYLENKDMVIYVRVPFLVGHDEELDSSVWGFSNVAYIDWIRNSEEKLLQMAEEFKSGQGE